MRTKTLLLFTSFALVGVIALPGQSEEGSVGQDQTATIDEVLRGIRHDAAPVAPRQPAPEPTEGRERRREISLRSMSVSEAFAEEVRATDLPPLPDYGFYLSELGNLIRRREGSVIRVHLVFPGIEAYGPAELLQGASIAQALALRSQMRPLQVDGGPNLFPGRLNVVVALRSELESVLPDALLQRIGRSGIALVPFPGFDDEPILVLTGRDTESLNQAILALGFANQSLPRASFASISSLALPEQPPFIGHPPLQPGNRYSFGQLVEMGASLRPGSGGGIALQTYLPADVFSEPRSTAELAVRFSIGQRTLRRSERMVVRLNGEELVRRSWQDTERSSTGGRFLRLSIPMERWLPGTNLIEITSDAPLSQAHSLIGGTSPEETDFQVFTDSTIRLPEVRRHTRLPDLRTTARTAFPFIGQPDGSDLAFFVTENNPDSVAAAWTLAAKMSQVSNTFMYEADFRFDEPAPERHLVVLGSRPTLPRELRERIPEEIFRIGDTAVQPEPVERAQDQEESSERWGWLTNLRGEVVRLEEPASKAEESRAESSRTRQRREIRLRDQAVLSSFAHPSRDDRWVFLLTASDSNRLLERTQQVVRHEFWTRVRGEAFTWAETPDSSQYIVPDPPPEPVSLQASIVPLAFGYGVTLRLWYFIIAGLLVLFIIATLVILPIIDRKRGIYRD